MQLLFVSASSLKCLKISSIDDMTSLQEEVLQHAILQMLTISSCNGLATLSNWIGKLNSLTWLWIYYCPALRSLPEEIGSLANLQTLIISSYPHLTKICQRETGEDWPKIANVPHIHIYSDEEWIDPQSLFRIESQHYFSFFMASFLLFCIQYALFTFFSLEIILICFRYKVDIIHVYTLCAS